MTFPGFARAAPGFFHQLAVEMDRAWFAAHKADYEALWVAPMTALLTEVRAQLARSYPRLTLAAPRLLRIHRDVRFSRDKTPYKLHAAGTIALGEGRATERPAALYLQLGADEEVTAAGLYAFDAAALARWRRQVLDARAGAALARLVEGLRAAGYGIAGAPPLARVPRGLPADHPRADLLRMRGLVATFPALPRGIIHQPALAGWLVEHGRRVAPLVRWLATHLDG